MYTCLFILFEPSDNIFLNRTCTYKAAVIFKGKFIVKHVKGKKCINAFMTLQNVH